MAALGFASQYSSINGLGFGEHGFNTKGGHGGPPLQYAPRSIILFERLDYEERYVVVCSDVAGPLQNRHLHTRD